MARILDFFLDRKTNRACQAYPDAQSLFNGLQQEESNAIRCLSSKISGSIFQIGKGYQLTDDDIEELICDCITICIQKIRTDQYVFQGYDPASFVIEIAKNQVKNIKRKSQKHETSDLEQFNDPGEEMVAGSGESTEILQRLLQKLDDSCQNLIRLKYLEELKDKDIIEQGITQYTTVDALKNHRAKCMKKLVELGASMSFIQS
ncbi:MAG: sigma-70 family RNA polymerase sigma factor [Saprospiraceae bacterium]|nr:sigma-70 family RNA polymerase sigma factor [Saprospiraceae bacterium]